MKSPASGQLKGAAISPGKAAQDSGIQAVFLDQDTVGKGGGGVAGQDCDTDLSEDVACIKIGGHLVHRAACFGIARIKGALMRVKAGVFRQQRRVDIQNPALKPADECGGQNAHEACKAQDVGSGVEERFQQSGLERRTVGISTVGDGGGGDPEGRRTGQARGLRVVRGNKDRTGGMVAGHRADKFKHVGATPGNQDGHAPHRRRPR
jgi:hypothetical protein